MPFVLVELFWLRSLFESLSFALRVFYRCGSMGATKKAEATPKATGAAVGAAPRAAIDDGPAAAVGAGPGTTAPSEPMAWAEIEKTGALQDNESCENYAKRVQESGTWRLFDLLRLPSALGGIELQTPLHLVAPLDITTRCEISKLASKTLHTYKEHWRWGNCTASLNANGMYEAPGNGFWLDIAKPAWRGSHLPAAGLALGQISAGRKMFSDEKFVRSSEDVSKRHYMISEAIPTAITNVLDVPSAAVGARGFHGLPCLGSRACLVGFYSVLDDALRAKDWLKVKKLFQAALCMPIRVRVAPSLAQVVLDSITYSEDLYAGKEATSDSFFDWTDKVFSLLSPKAAVDAMMLKDLKAAVDKLAVTYHGVAPSVAVLRAFQNCAPFVASEAVGLAFKEFEHVSSVLNDQTKLPAIFLVATKAVNGGRTVGVPDAAVGACRVLRVLRRSLLYGDIAKESHITNEFLVGGRAQASFVLWTLVDPWTFWALGPLDPGDLGPWGPCMQAGFVQVFFKRMAFIDFIQTMVLASSEAHAEEARAEVFPKLAKSDDFYKAFLRPLAQQPAAVGANDDADGEPDETLGLGHATAEKFATFRAKLDTRGKHLADLLMKTHTGAFDTELKLIAEAEIKTTGFAFGWAELFKEALNGKSISGLSLKLLQTSCIKWLQSTLCQPAAESSAIGDADRTLKAAEIGGGGGDHDEDQLRTKTLGKLNDILAKLVALVVREGDVTASLTKTVKNCSRPTGLKTEQKPAVGGDCRLWLACAELFPEHAKLHHPDAFRGVPLQCATEFQDLIGWMAQAKDSKDAAVIADGRSEIVRKAVREKMTSAVGDSEFIELWLVYDMETSLNTDVRNPKRKLAWSGANTEIIFAMPPPGR